MNETAGIFRDGHVELNAAVDWPNGTPVRVQPQLSVPMAPPSGDRQETWGIDDDWPDTPENRAEILRRMDAATPLEMSPAEEAEWQAMLKWFDDHSRQAVRRDMGLEP